MHQLAALFQFYKPYLFWSVLITIILKSLGSELVVICISKFVLIGFLWYTFTETTLKRQFIFYKNLGITAGQLFGAMFLFDLMVTLLISIILNSFL
ncbi:hypothetical protein ACFSQP_00400 [Bizionia sediminis]|uniref:Uncharacterized protein n=1 Tax=Bizionia sediminis TaxID=1737064 RepID=A0ABW5KPD9_9FLAO